MNYTQYLLIYKEIVQKCNSLLLSFLLPMNINPKILGLTLDPKLTYNKHIRKQQQMHARQYIYLYTNTMEESKRNVPHNKAITRPIVEYTHTTHIGTHPTTRITYKTQPTTHPLQYNKQHPDIINKQHYLHPDIDTNPNIIDDAKIKTNMKHIHATIGSTYLCNQQHNKVTNTILLTVHHSPEKSVVPWPNSEQTNGPTTLIFKQNLQRQTNTHHQYAPFANQNHTQQHTCSTDTNINTQLKITGL